MTGTNRQPLPILKMPSPHKGSLSPSILEETNSKLSLQRLVVLLGPTAVGKSDLAIQLAEQLNGEIISADSRLFYRGMDIGTAKPSSADRQRIPHHLIDVAYPDQTWSLGVFQQQARRAIQDVNDRGKLPFLVGGTGQYIWAVVEGWQVPPVQPDPHLRDALMHWADEIGPVELHHRLEIIDPSGAALIDPTNLRRTIRALEVSLSSGVRFSEQRRRGVSPYNTLLVGLTLPRSELYQRIDERIQIMLSQGFVEEVRSLLAQGFSPNLPTEHVSRHHPLDPDGFLLDPTMWSESLADRIAQDDGLGSLNELQVGLLHTLRQGFAKHGSVTALSHVCHLAGKGPDCMQHLFPSPARGMAHRRATQSGRGSQGLYVRLGQCDSARMTHLPSDPDAKVCLLHEPIVGAFGLPADTPFVSNKGDPSLRETVPLRPRQQSRLDHIAGEVMETCLC